MPGKTSRRAKGEGSIHKMKNGKFRAMVSWVDDSGKRRRASRVATKQGDAVAHLKALQEAAGSGSLTSNLLTIGALLDRWMKLSGGVDKAENTVDLRKITIKNHIKPRIGSQRVTGFKRRSMETFLEALVDEDVGNRTRQLCYEILTMAFNWAKDNDIVGKNPVKVVKKPQYEREEIFPFSVDETRRILKETVGHRFHLALQLFFCCGLRQGECLGLDPADLSFGEKTLSINKQLQYIRGEFIIRKPKTKSGVRIVDLPENVINAAVEHNRIRLKEGHARAKMLFPNIHGDYTAKGTFNRRFWLPLLKRLNLEPRGVHHARHTFATTALIAGVPVHVVSKILGHSKPSVTWDLYSHVLKEHRSEASQTVGNLFSNLQASNRHIS